MEFTQKQFWKRCYHICTEPTEFFSKLKTASIRSPLIHFINVIFVGMGTFILILGAIISIILAALGKVHYIGWVWLIGAIYFIAAIVINIPILFINAGVYHLFVRLFKGKGSFKDTFAATAYAMTPAILIGIFILNMILGIYIIVLQCIGISKVHKLSIGKSVAAVLLPIALMIGLVFVVYVIIYIFVLVSILGAAVVAP